MRYTSYCVGIILLFVVVVVVNQRMHTIDRALDAASYLHQQSLLQQRAHGATDNTGGTPAPQIAYIDAPRFLQQQPQFQQLMNSHGAAVKDTATERTPGAQHARPPRATIVRELSDYHGAVLTQTRAAQAQLVMISSPLLIVAVALLLFPLVWQRNRSLRDIAENKRQLRQQTLELRALHTTIGNMLEDILHQQRQATRTSQVNARLAAVINSAEDAIFSLNLAGFVTTANLAATIQFGNDCEGKRFVDLFPEDLANELQASLMVTAEQNSGSTIDITMQKQQRVDLSLTISPIRAQDQSITGFSVIAKDVSNSRQEEERFRLAVEAAPNAMIMINARGVVVLINSEAERMFGYARDELYGQPLQQLIPEELPALAELGPAPATTHEPHYRGLTQLHGQRRCGQTFPIEVGLTPLNIEHETFIISSIVDISERIAQQIALTDLNQELSHKNREMEQFIYTISHDLKAPLVTIAGFATRLLQEKDGSLSAAQQHKVERIAANAKSMETLLQDLLHLSRVIKRDLNKSWVDTEAAIAKVLDSLEGAVHKSQAQITLHRPLDSVYAQEGLLCQCLQNVISNSIKYSAPGVRPQIDIKSVAASGFTGIKVVDNGIGVAEKFHQKIFDVFERLNPEAGEGTGVGLSIVKTIIEKHRGKIEFTSSEGEGTAFTLLFPIKHTAEEE